MASPSSPTDSNPPSAVPLPLPLPPPPSASTSSRRLPPPCWTPEETAALIDAYRDKWYSLGRTNLKATHWQEVADAITERCPNASPTAKTAVQCRHKMEKLRKRYRTEIQRLRSLPLPRLNNASPSSWVHFKSMDSMEKGPNKPNTDNNNNNLNFHDDNNINNDNDMEEDDDIYEEFKNGPGSNTRSLNKLYKSGFNSGSGSGFRIRIPAGVQQPAPAHSKFFNGPPPGMMPRRASNGVKRERENEALAEMVGAIKVLRDGFVRMEQMKMEMAREIESMRMEMEMKRTEMILDSQHRIVEAFARAVSQKRTKPKSTPSPSSQP